MRNKSALPGHHLSAGHAEVLYAYLEHRPGTAPVFNFTHILYYLGGLTAIGAMTLFMNLGWEEFGGLCLLALPVRRAGFLVRAEDAAFRQ